MSFLRSAFDAARANDAHKIAPLATGLFGTKAAQMQSDGGAGLSQAMSLMAKQASGWEDLSPYSQIEHYHTCACIACMQDRDDAEADDSGGTVNAANGNMGTLSDMADFLMTGYWSTGYGDNTRSHNVTNSGFDANNGVLHYNVTGYNNDADGLSDARANLVREAFKLFEATLGIQFVETESTDANLVDFFFRDNDGGAYASSGYWNSGQWGSSMTSSQINIATSWSGGTSSYDDYTLQTILHEIGHALGLGHQGSYNGSAAYGVDNTFDNDSWQASMMSYFSQTQSTAVDANYELLQTPMAVDWVALNALYGRQGFGTFNAFTEDTTWGFNTTVTSDVSDIWAKWSQWGNRTASTLVDGGGIDTLDLSGYTNNTLINLAPSDLNSVTPSASNIGGKIGNLTIAVGTIIENAIGGAGSETFFGNDADNLLIGNGGNDTFHDSIGSDTYDGGSGTDYVVFGANFADYSYSLVNGVLRVIDDAFDWVEDTIEWLTFSDQTLTWQAVVDSIDTPNTAPTVVSDAYSVTEDISLSGVTVLGNDTDAEGNDLNVASIEGQAVEGGGTTVMLSSGAAVTMYADGTFDYDQNGAFDGLNAGEQATDTFTYRASDGIAVSGDATVTITIDGVTDNTAPIAQNDTFITGESDIYAGSVLVNDTDANNDTLTVTALNGSAGLIGVQVSLASGALLTLNSDGSFDYDPNGAFDGLNEDETATETFSYAISDGNGGTDTATVTLRIDGTSPPVMDQFTVFDFEAAPLGAYTGENGLIFTGLEVIGNTSLAGARTGIVNNDVPVSISSATANFDLDGLSLIGVSGRQKVVIAAYNDGVLVGTQQVNVSDRKITNVTLDEGFDNVDSVSISGSKSFLIDDIAVLTRTVLDPDTNSAPLTVNDSLTTDESTPASGNLLLNDSDPNGDILSLMSINGDASGTVVLPSGAVVSFSDDGNFTYDANGAFDTLYEGQTGEDSFAYVTTDGQGGESVGTARITINGQGAAPAVTTLDFEMADLVAPGTVIDGAFIFSGATLSNDTGVTSGTTAISSTANTLSFSQLTGDVFDFEAGLFTLGGNGQQDMTVQGYRDGILVGSESFRNVGGKESNVALSDDMFDRVDEIVIVTNNGVSLDDLSFLA